MSSRLSAADVTQSASFDRMNQSAIALTDKAVIQQLNRTCPQGSEKPIKRLERWHRVIPSAPALGVLDCLRMAMKDFF